MAEENLQDASGKTEKPTEHRLEKAIKKGNMPQSRDFYHVVVLGFFLVFVGVYGHFLLGDSFTDLRDWLAKMGSFKTDGLSFHQLLQDLFFTIGLRAGAFFGLLVLGVLLMALIQFQGRIPIQELSFKWERLSIVANAKRLFSANQLVEFLKNIFKFLLFCAVLFYASFDLTKSIPGFCGGDVFFGVLAMENILQRLLMATVLGTLLLAALDYGYQWFSWFKKLFMSRQEVMDEHKELERDPTTAMRQRQMRKEWQEMKKARTFVPDASVLIVNPSHYAVAISWIPHKMMAPEVIAKGTDRVALYMKDLAKQYRVPLVENKPLAQGLYKSVPTGSPINPQHYKAVAQVIYYVMQRNKMTRQNKKVANS